MPTPPRQIRAVSDHVYFYLDKSSPLWPEFSVASGHRPSFRRRLAGSSARPLGDHGRPEMSGKDDPFGIGGKTVILPNSGRRAAAAIRSSRCRRSRRTRGAASSRYTSLDRHQPLVAAAASRRAGMPAAGSRTTGRIAAPMRPAQNRQAIPETERRRRSRRRRRIPLEVALSAPDAVEFPAANPITAAAAPLLILLGRLRLHIVDMQAVPLMNHVASSITEFEKKILEAGVPPRRGAGRQIRALRHRRRHRPEPARHRPARLDAVQHAGAVLPGAHLRRRLLRGAEQGARQPGAALQPARADACLPVARLRGPVSRRRRRRQRIAAHPPRRLPDAAPCEGAQRRRHLAALARPGAAGCAISAASVPLWAIASVAGAAARRRLLPAALPDRQRRRMRWRSGWSHCIPTASDRASTRPAFKPYVPPPVERRRRSSSASAPRCADEIAAGGMAVEPVGDQIVVRVSNLVLFASGKADVKPEFEPAGKRRSPRRSTRSRGRSTSSAIPTM